MTHSILILFTDICLYNKRDHEREDDILGLSETQYLLTTTGILARKISAVSLLLPLNKIMTERDVQV